jgi:hypothetical protein
MIQFFQRLFVLDTQARHLCQVSLNGLGNWLARKWFLCQDRKREAEAALANLGIPEDELRRHWDEQVKAQTKPLPRWCLPLVQIHVTDVVHRPVKKLGKARNRVNPCPGEMFEGTPSKGTRPRGPTVEGASAATGHC